MNNSKNKTSCAQDDSKSDNIYIRALKVAMANMLVDGVNEAIATQRLLFSSLLRALARSCMR